VKARLIGRTRAATCRKRLLTSGTCGYHGYDSVRRTPGDRSATLHATRACLQEREVRREVDEFLKENW
jgi:hypothetical protein